MMATETVPETSVIFNQLTQLIAREMLLCLVAVKSSDLAFTLVSCSAYFFDPENGGDIFLRNIG
jgi:hypothetical protein